MLQDRFRSMIVRGKIESRNKITQPKKPKVVEKVVEVEKPYA